MARIWSRFLGGAASSAAGYGIGSALGPALAPITQDVANFFWTQYATKPVNVGAAAEALVRGLIDEPTARGEAAQTGYKKTRFDALVNLARARPTVGELQTLRNRKVVLDPGLDEGLHRLGYNDTDRTRLAGLRFVLPPVSDLVRMAVREVFNPAQRDFLRLDDEYPEALTEAAEAVGMSRKTAGEYWAAHWELPSFTQAQEMLFRTDLGEPGFKNLLKALDYSPAWRDRLFQIAHHIPPISDMIRFAVREVYSPEQVAALGLATDYPEQFTKEAALHGMPEQRAKQYWYAHWRLPSAEQGYRMLWRVPGFTDADLSALLRALDYPPIWRERLKQISHTVPGRIDLRRMLQHGVIDRDEVKRGYQRLGYVETDAETLTKFAEELALAPATESWVPKAETQLWSSTHRSYLMGETDDAGVQVNLGLVGVPLAERDRVMMLWQAERDLVRRTLSPVQIRKAYTKGVDNPRTGIPWTRDDALVALENLGYARDDATVFLDEA